MKRAEKNLHRGADQIEKMMVELGSGLEATIRVQQKFLKDSEGRIEELQTELEAVESALREYTDDGREHDLDYDDYRSRRNEIIFEIEDMTRSRIFAEETVAEGKMLFPGGLSTEVPTLGPNANEDVL